MFASGAEQQSRRDFDAAYTAYKGALRAVKANKLTARDFLSGTAGKPPPLDTHTPFECSVLTHDARSAALLRGGPNEAIASLPKPRDPQMIRSLLALPGADIEARSGSRQRRLIHLEVVDENLEGVEALHRAGANLEARDNQGVTPLYLALLNRGSRAPDLVSFLLEAGAQARQRDPHGRSMLGVALHAGAPKRTVEALLVALQPLCKGDTEVIEAWASAVTTPRAQAALGHRAQGVREIIVMLHGRFLDLSKHCAAAFLDPPPAH